MPGGFGKRGIEGMMNAIRYARENNVPYFGICLGMQTACDRIRAQRLRAGGRRLHRIRSGHAAPRDFQVARAEGRRRIGRHHAAGSLALQARAGTLAHKIYGEREISERHRHRYEFNREYEETLTAGGLRITGSTPDGTYVEMVEIPDHPWFLGCQFHPEFKSKPLEPHPLFKRFIGAAYESGQKRRAEKTASDVEMFHRPEKVRS